MANLGARESVPVLVFSGHFFTDVATVNNDPAHFDVKNFASNWHLVSHRPSQAEEGDVTDEQDINGWWNPNGTSSFSLRNCRTTNAIYANGDIAIPVSDHGDHQHSETEDDAIGQPIFGSYDSVDAKLVDLDSQDQNVSTIFGLKFNIGDRRVTDDDGGNLRFDSQLDPTPFMDLWRNMPDGTGDPSLSAVFQGVVKVSTKWNVSGSRFFTEAAHVQTADPDMYVLRMTTDNFAIDIEAENFCVGRVVGTLRPYLSNQPKFFDAGRIMRPIRRVDDHTPLAANMAYAYVEQNQNDYFLAVELGNSLTSDWDKKTLNNQGDLRIVCAENEIATISGYSESESNWRSLTAGYMKIPLSQDVYGILANTPIKLKTADDTELLTEPSDGIFVRADEFVFRMSPETPYNVAHCKMYITKFGVRHPTRITVGFDSTLQREFIRQYTGLPSGPKKVGAPQGALILMDGLLNTPPEPVDPDLDRPDTDAPTTTIYTNSDGTAVLRIISSSEGPRNPRNYIDGQVYGLRYGVNDSFPEVGATKNASETIHVLLFDKFEAPENPTWVQDISPIFEQYAVLYPAMSRVVNLADYADCMARRYALRDSFMAEVTDPRYMPVTRDLSPAKRTMITSWFNSALISEKPELPLYCDTNSVSNLKTLLQTAIELEHATIPPYLTALYSIKPGANEYVAETLRSVVMEEMFHLAMVCNILISIGEKPEINKPNFIPKYPGPLPGGLRPNLVVHLRKCSIEQIRTFMEIEEPRERIVTKYGHVPATEVFNRTQHEQFTIGYLYEQIKRALTYLSQNNLITFGKDDYKQVAGPRYHGRLKRVETLLDAIESINTIVDEGEGCTPANALPGHNPTANGENNVPETGPKSDNSGNSEPPELAHYYRFAEIVNGRRIIVDDAGGFSYTGDKIPFDPDGVYNMTDDPDVYLLPKGSKAWGATEAFNRRYHQLLTALQKTFDGNPQDTSPEERKKTQSANMTQAVSNMFQLTMYAEPLMKMSSHREDGTTAGISFQMPSNFAYYD